MPGVLSVMALMDADDGPLSCPVCLETFRMREVVPLLLTGCGHSVCRACLRGMQGALQGSSHPVPPCPLCRALVTGTQWNLALAQLGEAVVAARPRPSSRRGSLVGLTD